MTAFGKLFKGPVALKGQICGLGLQGLRFSVQGLGSNIIGEMFIFHTGYSGARKIDQLHVRLTPTVWIPGFDSVPPQHLTGPEGPSSDWLSVWNLGIYHIGII